MGTRKLRGTKRISRTRTVTDGQRRITREELTRSYPLRGPSAVTFGALRAR